MDVYFHIHHEVLWEFATEPIENRIEFIKNRKPEDERETRLRLLRKIPSERVPAELVIAMSQYKIAVEQYEAAAKEYDEAWQNAHTGEKEKDDPAWEKLRAAWQAIEAARQNRGAAWRKYEVVEEQFHDYMETLHQELCPNCPWDGHTIFPGAYEEQF